MTDGEDEYEIADISFAPIPLGSIYFHQKDKPKLKYIPQDDITPYETTLVLDSDYIINSSALKGALERECDFQNS